MSLIAKLDSVLALAEKATPGEWVVDDYGDVQANGEDVMRAVGAYGYEENEANAKLTTAAINYFRDHGPAIRQALLKAELWDKHAGSFETLEAMLEIASPLVLNKLKAKDAAIDARLASDSEGGSDEQEK